MGVLTALLDLFLPRCCVLCGRGDETICSDCMSKWSRPARRCAQVPFPTFAVHEYDVQAARVIVGAKDHHRRWFIPLIATSIASACEPLLVDRVLLVPVPSRPSAIRRRGEDFLLTVAHAVALELRGRGVSADAHPLLTHSRSVVDQSKLTAEQRHRNLDHAFMLTHRFTSRIARREVERSRIIVIDDLITTGASITEARRVLLPHFDVLGGACAASTSLSAS